MEFSEKSSSRGHNNQPASGNAVVTPRLAIEYHWRGVPEPERLWEHLGVFTVQLSMNKMFKRLVLLGTAAGMFSAASVGADDKTNYITAREITAMTPCTATFAKRFSEYS